MCRLFLRYPGEGPIGPLDGKQLAHWWVGKVVFISIHLYEDCRLTPSASL